MFRKSVHQFLFVIHLFTNRFQPTKLNDQYYKTPYHKYSLINIRLMYKNTPHDLKYKITILKISQ